MSGANARLVGTSGGTRFLTDAEATAVAMDFRRRHPWRMRLMGAILGWGDLRADDALRQFVRNHPFVALRPAR